MVAGSILTLSGRIRERAEELGWGRFWPRYFADELHEPLEAVVRALRVLEEQGHLISSVRIECENEHEWRGDLSRSPKRCPVCDVAYDDETTQAEVVFELKKKVLTTLPRA